MPQIAKMLIVTFVVFLINGCGYKLVVVPQKCVIPKTQSPNPRLAETNSTLGESKRCAFNYFQIKEAFEIQTSALELCQ